jgi:hypothetical protein
VGSTTAAAVSKRARAIAPGPIGEQPTIMVSRSRIPATLIKTLFSTAFLS